MQIAIRLLKDRIEVNNQEIRNLEVLIKDRYNEIKKLEVELEQLQRQTIEANTTRYERIIE